MANSYKKLSLTSWLHWQDFRWEERDEANFSSTSSSVHISSHSLKPWMEGTSILNSSSFSIHVSRMTCQKSAKDLIDLIGKPSIHFIHLPWNESKNNLMKTSYFLTLRISTNVLKISICSRVKVRSSPLNLGKLLKNVCIL